MLRQPTIFLSLCLLLISACSTVQIQQPPEFAPEAASLQAEQPDRAWWQLRIRLQWPEGEQPDFSQHLLVADQVLAPALVAHEDSIALWRFHRRAGRDRAGHQFSLILYTDQDSANAFYASVNSHPLMDWLLQQDMIDSISFKRRTREELAALEDTSDREWPIEIQRSWPYFIMGASQAWLSLVRELSDAQPLQDNVGYDELLTHYQLVNSSLSAQWRDYGQHAYLHHLSAVFGYQPIRVRSSELKTF